MRRSLIAAILIVGLALTSCSSGKKSGATAPPSTPTTAASTTPTLDRAAAEAQIKTNWAAFFSKETPLAKKLDYL